MIRYGLKISQMENTVKKYVYVVTGSIWIKTNTQQALTRV